MGNKFVDHSDVVGASPVGIATTTSSFSTKHWASMDWERQVKRLVEKCLSFGTERALYQIFEGIYIYIQTNSEDY